MRHSQLTDDLQEQASLYAAGALPESERSEYARHLEEEQCVVCRAEVDELRAAMGLLAFSVPPASPSPGVRARLMEQARNAAPSLRQPSFLRRWLPVLTTAAAAAAVIVALAATRANEDLRRLTEMLVRRINQLEIQVSQQRTYLATLTSPEVRVLNLARTEANAAGSGRVFWDQSQKKWLLYVYDLPRLPDDRIYQLWFIPQGGNPLSAGTFNTEGDGSYQLEIDLGENMTSLKAAAITNEPAPGVDQPTSAPILAGTE